MYKAKYDYVMCNLISKYNVKPVEVIGKLGFYDEDELNSIRKFHIDEYIKTLRSKGLKGEAFAITETELVSVNDKLTYKQHFARGKAKDEKIPFVTALSRLNKGITKLGVNPVGFTYNGKLIYLSSDLRRAYNFFKSK